MTVATTSTLTEKLLPQHVALLRASAICDEVALARGYFSAKRKSELQKLGFRSYQQRVPSLVVPIRDVHGALAFHQIRPDRPRISHGKELKYETSAGSQLVIDVHPHTASQVRDPKTDLWITEGSRKVDAAISAGLCCIGVVGVWGWRGTNTNSGKTALACWDSIALNGRTVYIAFDSDVMTKEAVNLALMRLKKFLEGRKADVKVLYLPEGENGEKVGLDDFLAAGRTVKELIDCVGTESTGRRKAERREDSQAKRLVNLADDSGLILFHDSEPTPYVTFTVGDHRETHPLESRAVRRWLAHRYYVEHGSAPSPEAITTARLTFEGRALFEGPRQDVYLRLAEDRGAIMLDLVDEKWGVFRIDATGWRSLASSAVRFRRAAGMYPLPPPRRGGSLELLRVFVNVEADDFPLLVGWLIAAFRPLGPFPVLILQGEQGSAKSTTSRVLRRLLDPNKAPLRAQPREPRDLAIAANNAWVVALDNLSRVPDWLSDGLCRLATGGGFATRALFTDSDESIFDAQRPIILNGIDSVATRGDLLDRGIVLNLPRLERVREEADFWREFEEARPLLLGAILDAVSTALRREAEVVLDARVRMADAARWVVAAEPSLPWEQGTFLRAYADNLSDSNELALEASPVAAEVQRLMADHGCWEGTATELLEALDSQASDGTKRLRSWPKTPRGLSGELRRLAPNLRTAGLEIEFGRDGRGAQRRRFISMEVTEEPSPPSPPSDPEESVAETATCDGPDGDGRSDDSPERNANRPTDRPLVTLRNPSSGDDGDGGDAGLPPSNGEPEHEDFAP
jgi:hypothetical protein